MTRRRVVAGNWKMFRTRREAISLLDGILAGADAVSGEVDLLVFPPFTALAEAAEHVRGTRIRVGGQNLHAEPEGAYTGEISARMLLEAGATHVLVGHSERRQHFAEDDRFLASKVRAALESGLIAVFCLGETLADRDAGRTESVLDRQLRAGLGEIRTADLPSLLIAYEPVWAIGTGRTATPDQARDAHRFLRDQMRSLWGAGAAGIPLLYGGSVKPSNARELMSQDDVDGVLVGGASLEAAAFLGIAAAA